MSFNDPINLLKEERLELKNTGILTALISVYDYSQTSKVKFSCAENTTEIEFHLEILNTPSALVCFNVIEPG